MSTVKTGDGKTIEVDQFSSGGWYARTPDWFPFSHTYEATGDTKAEVLQAVAANHDGIKCINDRG
jgi:hypothetical protein